jgi:protein-S-isoprenylcysteine O-methyltransferase Ste14
MATRPCGHEEARHARRPRPAAPDLSRLILLFPCLLVVDRFVIRREERYLSLKFGPAYDDYRQQVRRWL